MINDVTQEVIELHSEGLSLIPVRDKKEVTRSGTFRNEKTPYHDWQKFQQERMTIPDLLSSMEKQNTEAVAIICGNISGNLEAIDIDSKYKPGIDATLFADLNRIYPELFQRLRIHRTPSGGYHILYRIEGGEVPGNKKLAGYLKEVEGKPKPEQINFIETRGEGGYVLAPPSMGYAVHQEAPIPVISWAERCSLIAICQSYTEIVKVEVKPKGSASKSENYSESPFEHYTASDEAAHVLIDNGWQVEGENSKYIYFTRPGKDSGISASFHKQHRLYYFFTTSTEFTSGKGLYPGTVLATLEHGGDFKATYRRLIEDGYGKYKPAVEKKIAKNAAKKGYELPANISREAKQEYQQIKAQLQEAHPYGTFWEYTPEGKPEINRQALHEVAVELGFRLHFGQPVRIVGYKVIQQEESDFFDTLKAYIQEEDEHERRRILHVYEGFLQKSGAFTIKRLPRLDESFLLTSSFTTSYKFYLNCYLEITGDNLVQHQYEDLGDRLVWASSILERDFLARDDYEQSLYYHFLNNAIGLSEHLMQVIGFYAHEFKDETTGYICVMVEQVANPEDGGGAGKNVFANLLRLTTSLKSMPGSQVVWSDKILSSWNMEKIFSISDAPQDTDFAFLKDLSTGEGSWKKLYKDPVTVPVHLMPKFLISTNFSYELSDGGLKRRIIPIEFTDFYTLRGGIDQVHGGHFPKDWDEEEYQWFDNIIIKAIQAYLRSYCKLSPKALTETGWEKQFKQTHGEFTWNFIQENWADWVQKVNILPEVFNKNYDTFCEENGISKNHRKSKPKLNKALAEYAKHHKITYNPKKPVRDGLEIKRHQAFES